MITRRSNYDKSKLMADPEPQEPEKKAVFDYAESLRLLKRLKEQIEGEKKK